MISFFEVFSQEDSIVISQEISNDSIEWQDIQFYNLESDGVWRARYDSGRVLSEAAYKDFFILKCFCKRRLPHGFTTHYNECAIVESVSIYKKGKWKRIK